jgi:4-hydroxy-3-polyprenylbenzoate decarboxylase
VREVGELTRMGVRIVPPMPAFYQLPATVDELVEHIASCVLDQLDLPLPGARRWQGMHAARASNAV